MQGLARDTLWITQFKLRKIIYAKSGYSSVTGGSLHNLRTSSTNEKARAYHRKFYKAENLTLIIAGEVIPERVFLALKPIQENIKSKRKGEVFERPWQSSVEKISQSQDIKVKRCSCLLI